MVVHQLPEKVSLLVQQHVVVADAAADEHLFYPRQPAQAPQKLRVFRVVCIQIFARLRGQAAAIFAAAVLFLPRAGGVAEVGRRPAHIVDVSLKLRVLGEYFRLPQDGFNAPGSDHPPLVKGQRTEIAPAEAAAVVDHAEAHLLDRGHAAERLVHRVPLAV